MLARLLRCDKGAIAIEVGIVAPVLILICLGAVETSRMFVRQHELQGATAEAATIAMAANEGATTDSVEVASLLADALGIDEEQVEVDRLMRCDTSADLVPDTTANRDACDDPDNHSTYMQITLSDTFRPFWVNFGISQDFQYRVVRLVQLS